MQPQRPLDLALEVVLVLLGRADVVGDGHLHGARPSSELLGSRGRVLGKETAPHPLVGERPVHGGGRVCELDVDPHVAPVEDHAHVVQRTLTVRSQVALAGDCVVQAAFSRARLAREHKEGAAVERRGAHHDVRVLAAVQQVVAQ
jgi:hypothetical protein